MLDEIGTTKAWHMEPDPLDHLNDLSKDALVQMLGLLARKHDEVRQYVEQALDRTGARLGRFREALSDLDPDQWYEGGVVAERIEDALDLLRLADPDPRAATEELLALLDRADGLVEVADTDGDFTVTMSASVVPMVIEYASRCEDREWMLEPMVDAWLRAEYDLMDAVLERAPEFLPAPLVHRLLAVLEERAGSERTGGIARRIASGLNDPALYERVAGTDPLRDGDIAELARINLAIGRADVARDWIERIPIEEGRRWDSWNVDALRLSVYTALEDTPRATETAWRMFRRDRTVDSLNTLIALEGESRRDEIIRDEMRRIESENVFSGGSLKLLVGLGEGAAAGEYVLRHRKEIRPNYSFTIPTARALEEAAPLAATVLYRLELDDVLAFGRSRAYHHAADYLHRLNALADAIRDWRGIEQHDAYALHLKRMHSRKRAFWPQYNAGRAEGAGAARLTMDSEDEQQ